MATARRETHTEVYVLRLARDEAEFLHDVLCAVFNRGRGVFAIGIIEALESAGIFWRGDVPGNDFVAKTGPRYDFTGEIKFHET